MHCLQKIFSSTNESIALIKNVGIVVLIFFNPAKKMKKYVVITIMMASNTLASERAALVTLAYHARDKEQPVQSITMQLPTINTTPQRNATQNYNETEKYFKCLMCICLPCYWCKEANKN